MPDEISTPVSELRATAHPLRLRMLSLLTNTEMSASELARELDVTTANASYHLRLLARAGLVEETGTEQIRGGVAKKYTHPWETAGTSVKADSNERLAYLRTLADELVRRATLPHPPGPTFTTDADLWVSSEVRDEAFELLQRAAFLLHGNAHKPRTEGTTRVSLTAAMFDLGAQS